MAYHHILFEETEGVATITLNRPEALNALTDIMMHEVVEVLEKIALNDELKVVVLTGAGTAFCSGADLKGGMSDISDARYLRIKPLGHYTDLMLHIARFEKPLIAAVNGHAAGGGYSLALACDFRIASENAKFTVVQARIGVIPDGGITYLLPRVVGVARALELMYTADTINATEAKEIGLVNRVIPADQLSDEVTKLALRIARGPSTAIELAKKAVYAALQTDDIATALAYETWAISVLWRGADMQEGMAAFLEKRPPKFTGK